MPILRQTDSRSVEIGGNRRLRRSKKKEFKHKGAKFTSFFFLRILCIFVVKKICEICAICGYISIGVFYEWW